VTRENATRKNNTLGNLLSGRCVFGKWLARDGHTRKHTKSTKIP
jgi:hypothetical protein